MASSPSWLQSLFSPAKNRWTALFINSLSERLRKYGFSVDSVMPEVKDTEPSVKSLREVEKIIGYNFNNQSLLQEALTHISCKKKSGSYERLEYVGDAVINLMITKQLFSMYPNLPTGQLSPLRAANVDKEKLARAAVKHNLHKYLRHTQPLLRKQAQAFINTVPKYPLHSYGMIDVPKFLSDIVESTVGAVFIDTKGLLDPIITSEMLQKNPAQKLNEICQKHRLQVHVKDLWLREGAVEVYVNDQLCGRGKYRLRKEIAMNRAAHDAYRNIVMSLGVKDSSNGDANS
ncbi:hypothetical protein RJ640_026096 [Escallonia rubra]|uniref:RNase III domain-containing protein n=1 Tax=Escallonia rubra TaxID=112253 RepID=A0AA88RMT7_9ASTE|nr:hypothetical protein RJ640_026096 [Escallonia rubra]